MGYKHLSLEERHYIEIGRREGQSLNKIAQALGRSQGTLSRELARNTGQRGYRHQQAQRMTKARHKEKPKAIKMTPEIKQTIKVYIEKDWSPEQVCGWLKKEVH